MCAAGDRCNQLRAPPAMLFWEISLEALNATAVRYTGPHSLLQRPRASEPAETIAVIVYLLLLRASEPSEMIAAAMYLLLVFSRVG